jgi:hypothetical protein
LTVRSPPRLFVAHPRFGCCSQAPPTERDLRAIPTSGALAERLAPIVVARERDTLAQDIRRSRRGGILVNTVNPPFRRWATTDPRFAAARADDALAAARAAPIGRSISMSAKTKSDCAGRRRKRAGGRRRDRAAAPASPALAGGGRHKRVIHTPRFLRSREGVVYGRCVRSAAPP